MGLFLGLLFAGIAAIGSWTGVAPATANLPGPLHLLTLVGIVTVSVAAAFLGGLAIGRRATTQGSYLRQFMTTTLVVLGALITGVSVGAITLAYLVGYGSWPVTPVETVLYVLSAPILGLCGAVVGGLVGLLCALIAGTVLRTVSPTWR